VIVERTLNKLGVKLKNSLDKHGDWSGYTIEQMDEKISGEMEEYVDAMVVNDMLGPHGAASELLDVAVTCIKMSYQITRRELCKTREDNQPTSTQESLTLKLECEPNTPQ
jgi:hypothetical protein